MAAVGVPRSGRFVLLMTVARPRFSTPSTAFGSAMSTFARPRPAWLRAAAISVSERRPFASGFVPDAIVAFQTASLIRPTRLSAALFEASMPASLAVDLFEAPAPGRLAAHLFEAPTVGRFAARPVADALQFPILGRPQVSSAPVSVRGVLPATVDSPAIRPEPTLALDPRVRTMPFRLELRTPPAPKPPPRRVPESFRAPRRSTWPPRLMAASLAFTAMVVLLVGVGLTQLAPDKSGHSAGRAGPRAVVRPSGVADVGGLLRDAFAGFMQDRTPAIEVSTGAGAVVEVEEGFGVVEIATDANLDVWIDDAPFGVVMGAGTFTVDVGDHVVEVRRNGFRARRDVSVEHGRASQMSFQTMVDDGA